MAIYESDSYVRKGTDPAFKHYYDPGTTAPLSGIYRCQNCGREAVSTKGHTLPPQNHHQHADGTAIQWVPIVKTQQQP